MEKYERILGVDLGTNSIGWAVIEIDHENRIVHIIALGSRILPMNADEISKFENGGKLQSSASNKTGFKSIRKNRTRFLLRRDRLHCVLNLLEMLPEHYKLDIEFIDEKGKRSGKIRKGKEPKLAYFADEKGNFQFLFKDSYREMEKEFRVVHPELFTKNEKLKENKRIPYDWTLYYLRKKALNQEITKEELAWVTMSFLQKRGYKKIMGIEDKEQKENELSEIINTKVKSVEKLNKQTSDGLNIFHIKLENEYGNIVFEYDESSLFQVTQEKEFKQLEIVSKFDKENSDKIKSVDYIINEIKNLAVIDVINSSEKRKEQNGFIIQLSSGWKYDYFSQYKPQIIDTKKDFIVSSIYNKEGVFNKRKIRMSESGEWELEKLKIESLIQSYNLKNNTKGIGSFVYDSLLNNFNQKIRAGLVSTIEREYYEEELKAILDKQKEFHPELRDRKKYQDALMLLYPNNESHRKTLLQQDFSSLIGNDLIFYQRDLKSKKSLISNCTYEYITYTKNGEKIKKPLTCIAKSNPLYQEFRLWQFLKCLRIFQKESMTEQGEIIVNKDVTDIFLTLPVKEELFGFLNNRKEITQDILLKKLKLDKREYKWNYEEDHKEKCNETRHDFIFRLKRVANLDYERLLNARHFLKKNSSDVASSVDGCYLLWNFFYSVRKKEERIKGLPKLIEKLLDNAGLCFSYKDKIVEVLSSISSYNNGYGTYSEKAIKKLLPFMRLGKYWNQEDIERIKMVDKINPVVLNKEKINGEVVDLQGLWLSSACSIVYGHYSEVGDVKRWTQPFHIKDYLSTEFKKENLNNPVVEKVLRETLMLIYDVWTTLGEVVGIHIDNNGNENKLYQKYFDKINIEIGTSLKNNSKTKELIYKRNKDNRLANERAIALLKELKIVYPQAGIKEQSPFQQERIKLLESGVLDSITFDKDGKEYDYEIESCGNKKFTKKEIRELIKKEVCKITKSDITRYRLWLEQRYVSPYTGKPISLSNLFNRHKYQVDHVFPQERITFNSFSNKVICEANINQAKGALTGYEFILNCNGKTKIGDKELLLLTPEQYKAHVKRSISSKEKQEILLSKDIPKRFGNNQLNNSRYIAKVAMKLLSNIVREEGEREFKSKNVLVVSGSVTSKLKKDWQLDETWNELIKPRFLRMEELTGNESFIEKRVINGHTVSIPVIPNKEIDKKRIDHRHHALDALIVAMATSNQVNYINNISALNINEQRKRERKDLKAKYMMCKKLENESKESFFLPPMQYKVGKNIITYKYSYRKKESHILLKEVVLEALQKTLVTYKQKNRIMRQRTNWIQHPDFKDGLKQNDVNIKNNYSIRQSLHKATFYGVREITPVAIEIAIGKYEKIVDSRVKHLIEQYKEQGKNNNEIISELKGRYEVVYVREKCAITQWGHSLDYLSVIKETDDDKKKLKYGKSAVIREIECIADIGIQNILKKHLINYDSVQVPIAESVKFYDDIIDESQKILVDEYIKKGSGENLLIDVFVRGREFKDRLVKHNPHLAFSIDGIKDMNDNIIQLNNGKKHKPVYKVKVTQALGKMFPISADETIKTVKNKQYVVTDAGGNNFCGIYKSESGDTMIYVPSLRNTIDSIRNNENLFPLTHPDSVQHEYKFVLSPLDMVYMPTEDEIINNYISDDIDYSRIYIVNDFNDQGKLYFRPYSHAKAIAEKEVDYRKGKNGKLIGSFDDKTTSYKDLSIKDYCIPIKVDRLGNITKIG